MSSSPRGKQRELESEHSTIRMKKALTLTPKGADLSPWSLTLLLPTQEDRIAAKNLHVACGTRALTAVVAGARVGVAAEVSAAAAVGAVVLTVTATPPILPNDHDSHLEKADHPR